MTCEKRYVITGGPCSGKSTLVDAIKERGFLTVDETAREFLKENPGIRGRDLVMGVFRRQIEEESALERYPNEVFLDRGLVDVAAYSRFWLGEVPREIQEAGLSCRYQKVFALDRLPFVSDGIRVEKNDAEAERIHRLIIQTYKEHGYEPLGVPVMSLRERADFVINNAMKGVESEWLRLLEKS